MAGVEGRFEPPWKGLLRAVLAEACWRVRRQAGLLDYTKRYCGSAAEASCGGTFSSNGQLRDRYLTADPKALRMLGCACGKSSVPEGKRKNRKGYFNRRGRQASRGDKGKPFTCALSVVRAVVGCRAQAVGKPRAAAI